MATNMPADPQILRTKAGTLNTNQNAGTYDILTATGDVWVEVVSAYVYTAGTGFTSVAIATNHTTPKSIVAALLVASATLDLAMTLVTTGFVLPSGKKIQGTLVGNGTGGLIYVTVKWAPITSGATLS